MALSIGTRLGVYEVTGVLGAGGMGEVYRARDTKLNRDVAIKILPDAFASDTERIARFTREAQTLATLNHPHIAQIHGLEESSGVRALVMELVAGEDLAERIGAHRALRLRDRGGRLLTEYLDQVLRTERDRRLAPLDALGVHPEPQAELIAALSVLQKER